MTSVLALVMTMAASDECSEGGTIAAATADKRKRPPSHFHSSVTATHREISSVLPTINNINSPNLASFRLLVPFL